MSTVAPRGPRLACRLAGLAVLAASVTAAGCGAGAASSPPATRASGPGAAFAWLRDKAEPWNHALNRDQRAIVSAAGGVTGISDTQYFSRLRTACSAMRADVHRAQAVPSAPSTSLERAWSGMLAGTATYASDCLTLARSHAAGDLTAWNNSLTSMNQASGTWNSAVTATRNGAHPSTG